MPTKTRVALAVILAALIITIDAGAQTAPTPTSPVGDAPVETAKAVTVANFVTMREAFGAWLATHQPPPAPVARASSRNSRRLTPSRSGGGVGACTGFAIPDYIIERESQGQPFVWNTQGSGAFGCAQTLITHYQGSGQCVGFDPNTLDGQRACVDKLSNHGTNLAPWGG